MALTTALSDAVLATSALGCALALLRCGEPRRLAGVGLGLVGLAAAFGTVRFAGVEAIAPLHDMASTLAGGAGVPSVGLAMVLLVLDRARWAWAVLPLLVTLTVVADLAGLDGARTGLGVVGLLGLIGACASRLGRASGPAAAGIAGALGTALAGLVIGTEGQLGPLLRVDVFHIVLAVSSLALGWCALHLPGVSAGAPDAPQPSR